MKNSICLRCKFGIQMFDTNKPIEEFEKPLLFGIEEPPTCVPERTKFEFLYLLCKRKQIIYTQEIVQCSDFKERYEINNSR